MSSIPLQSQDEIRELYLALVATEDKTVSTARGDDKWIEGNAIGHISSRQQALIRELDEQLTMRTATGVYLDRHVECHLPDDESARQAATKWYGVVRLTNTTAADILVDADEPASADDGNQYKTSAAVTVPAGSTADVAMESTTTGASATKANGSILTMTSPPVGISADASVVSTTTSSEDVEEDEDYRLRGLNVTRNSPGGGNDAHYEQWVRNASGAVGKVFVYDRWFGRGTVHVVPLGESGERILADAVITEILEALAGTATEIGDAPAGVEVTVAKPSPVSVDVGATVEPQTGSDPDWSGSYTVGAAVGGDALTRVRVTGEPVNVVVGKRVVVHFGTGGSEVVLEKVVAGKGLAGGSYYVDVNDPEGEIAAAANAGTTMRSGGPLWEPMRAAVAAVFDGLGPSRCTTTDLTQRWPDPDRESYPEALRSAINAAMKGISGTKNVTVSTPAIDITNAVAIGATVKLNVLGLFDVIWS